MTNVSKRPLSIKKRTELFQQFSALFINAGDTRMASVFMELFTEAEQVMFIKRVGILFMLHNKFSNYEIAKTLLVSPATVKLLQQKILVGEFDNMLIVMKRKTFDSTAFWSVIETVLRAGLPPRGRGRWSSVIKSINR